MEVSEGTAFARLADEWGRRRRPFLFVVDYELRRFRLWPLEAVPPSVRFEVRGRSNVRARGADDVRIMAKQPMPFEVYARAFQKAQYHLQRGDTYLLNMTFPTPVELNRGLAAVFGAVSAPYKLWMAEEMVVFSPECFVRIEDGFIRTFPMKGTADASVPGSREALLADPKEEWEHATVVDLLRNDLAMVSERVRVVRYRYVSRVRTQAGDLWQVSSEIAGRLPRAWHERVGSILLPMLPAGSISGAPKARTVEIIRRLEGADRGWFTGIFGIYDGRSLDSAVMIRFIEQRGPGTFRFRSGGGITAYSNARSEYEEMLRKVYLPV